LVRAVLILDHIEEGDNVATAQSGEVAVAKMGADIDGDDALKLVSGSQSVLLDIPLKPSLCDACDRLRGHWWRLAALDAADYHARLLAGLLDGQFIAEADAFPGLLAVLLGDNGEADRPGWRDAQIVAAQLWRIG
jgi:hypothetical protein